MSTAQWGKCYRGIAHCPNEVYKALGLVDVFSKRDYPMGILLRDMRVLRRGLGIPMKEKKLEVSQCLLAVSMEGVMREEQLLKRKNLKSELPNFL